MRDPVCGARAAIGGAAVDRGRGGNVFVYVYVYVSSGRVPEPGGEVGVCMAMVKLKHMRCDG